MLARSPISQVWKDEAEHFSRLVENGITLAIVDRSYGTWDGRIEQTARPFKSRTTRLSLGGLRGFASREAAKIAVEDAIHSIRSEERVSAEAAVVGSQAIRSTHGRDPNDEHRLSKSQLL